jgi:phenylacetate-coenzyme A ligase PaaK-like adenylate-forming protein
MLFDLSKVELKNRAFSERPMTFIDQESKNFLAAVLDLVAIETGNRAARKYWQQKQLQNLLQHAVQKSEFWRKRLGSKNAKDIELSDLPVLDRSDVVKQVETEGSLLRLNSGIATKKLATSGSSGTPASFFVSDMNEQYNTVRSLAQYFMEGRDLTLNRTRIYRAPKPIERGFSSQKSDNGLGPLSSVLKCGDSKDILHYRLNRDLLLAELSRDPIGYLVVQPSFVEALFHDCDVSFLSRNGTEIFVATDEEADDSLREKFAAARIPVRAIYSSSEVGYIAAECKDCTKSFHVAESNVIVEIDNRDSVTIDGRKLGRVLVTHLHSYATPFVRYEIGDFAVLSERCPCGHNGPVLSHIYGKKKRLLKRTDGSVSPFSVTARNILAIVKCDEYRIRQTGLKTIDVELGGAGELSGSQTTLLQSLLKERAGDEFQIRVTAVQRIDWGTDSKRLGFRSDVM